MATEFGFQSWPSVQTLLTALEPEDLYYMSPALEHRQHHADGSQEMLNQLQMQIPIANSTINDFNKLSLASQIVQAMAMKTETEFYRRSRLELEDGEGHTMGALYWQLNDIWQAPSWASIEYGGKWKVLQYYAANFFAPVAPLIYFDNNTLVSTQIYDVELPPNVTNNIRCYVYDVVDWTHSRQYDYQVPAEGATKVIVKSFDPDLPVVYSVCIARLVDLNDTQIGPETFAFNNMDQVVLEKKPTIEISNATTSNATTLTSAWSVNLEVSSRDIAIFVWLDTPGYRGRFSDNGFTLLRRSRSLVFYGWDELDQLDLNDFRNNITVTSLADLVLEDTDTA
jgi:beta-mannosidase